MSNIFGGYIDVNCVYMGYDKPDAYTKSFSIVFQGMPKEACVALATKGLGFCFIHGTDGNASL